jgi:hypothetical protein
LHICFGCDNLFHFFYVDNESEINILSCVTQTRLLWLFSITSSIQHPISSVYCVSCKFREFRSKCENANSTCFRIFSFHLKDGEHSINFTYTPHCACCWYCYCCKVYKLKIYICDFIFENIVEIERVVTYIMFNQPT